MLFLFLSSLLPAFASVKSCGGLFTITKLALSPDVVRPGDNVTLTLNYVNPITVTGGTVKNTATYNFIPLSPTTTDLCQTVPCPLQPGEYDGSSSFVIPTGLTGSLVLKTQWLADTALLCITSTIKVNSRL
jgi:hypothetical protein